MTTMVALFAALAPTAFTAAGATAPDSVSLALEGCRINASVTLPIGGKFVCPDALYTTGNLGKGWNELDLVPYRLTADAGNAAPASQSYSLTIVVDREDAGAPGYDFLSVPVLNDPLSDSSCDASPDVSAQLVANPGLGGIDKSLYRDVTITQAENSTCVYDYYARLALGSHLFPGSSLHANLANETLGNGGIGARDVSIPVKEISPQELDKDMSATKDSDHSWNLTKSATPATYRFDDTCSTASSGASTSVEVTLTWTKGPGNAEGYTVTTNIYATNPASRSITVNVTDEIYSDTKLLDTKVFAPVDVPANTANFLVGSNHATMGDEDVDDPADPDFNDVATATYSDKVTDAPIAGTTQATASVANSDIGTGTVTNATATITDTESITGDGFAFSAAAPSKGSFSGYTAGTETVGPVVWNSGTLSTSGSVTFDKTVYLDKPRVSSGELSDSAELTGSNGATATASAATALSANTTVSITVNKTIPAILDDDETQAFTFRVRKASDKSVVETVKITFSAGETSKSATVSGLVPGIYYVSEDVVLGWNHQPDSAPIDLSVDSDGSLTCSGSVRFDNTFGPAVARVVKTTEPTGAGRENGWTMCFEGPGAAGGKECVVTAAGDRDLNPDTPDEDGVAVFATELQNGGSYTITEVLKAGVRQSGSTGDCSFNVSYPADFGRVFTCGFTNEELGRIIVKKVTDPAGDSALFNFKLSGGPLALDMPFSLRGGEQRDSGHLQAGSGYKLVEDSTSGWDFAGAVCDDGSPTDNITVSPGEVVTCTVNNTKHGDVGVTKTVSGQVPPAGSSFTFQVRKGASAAEAGTVLLTDTSDAAGVVDFGGATLSPGSYQLCEAGIPAGWLSGLSTESGSFVPNQSSDAVCIGFALDPGEHQRFQVDNTPPPPPPVVVLGAVELPRTGAGMLALLLMTGSGLTLAGQAARAGRRRLRRA